MEKGKNLSSSSKSTVTDSKNKQDAVANKHLRLPRVKDNISPRPNARRKQPNPQRNREHLDKRAKNRTGAFCEEYRSEVTDQALVPPLGKHGCKKTNLNHLLNFTLATHDNYESSGQRNMYNRPKLPKYNKELFLQANCQFVVRDNGNYSIQWMNPDILVEWSLIEEIRLSGHEVPLCPICLYVPVAAKITRCGHVYCWQCMLHYLSLTDKTWQKCPICFEAVYKTDLKSVSICVKKSFTVGEEITMCLMNREKGSLLSIPITGRKPSDSVCNVDDVDTITRYQKLLLASPNQVLKILELEHIELIKANLEGMGTPEVVFIESALQLLNERKLVLEHIVSTESTDHSQELTEKCETVGRRQHLSSTSSTNSNVEPCNIDMNANSTKLDSVPNVSTNKNISSEPENKGMCFFYQAEDGQHIYLHNINVRMLLKEFGSLEFGPHIISAKIVEVEQVSMNEALRKRLRYLQHLPLTCEFQIVELDFCDVVSNSTLLLFESEIKKRKMFRNRKARDERRRERKIEQEENRKIGIYPQATYNLSSAAQFPTYNPEDFLSLSPPRDAFSIERNSENDNSNCAFVSDVLDDHPSPETQYGGSTSFAQMLRSGPETFNQKMKRSQSKCIAPVQPLCNADSEEDCTPAPEYRQSFSDAIQAAFDAVSLQGPSDKSQSSAKKKKKGKKQLLFTTSMCRTK